MAVVIKGSGSIEGSTGLEMGANGTTEIRGQVNVAVGSSVAGVSTATHFAPTLIPTSNRNKVINGDMRIAQRHTSVGSINSNGYYTVDRMNYYTQTAAVLTQSQVTDVPTTKDFDYSLKWDVTTAATPSAAQQNKFSHRIEARNLYDFNLNRTDANPITLSFWIKSTKTGVNVVELANYKVTSTRRCSKTYTINTTDTWEYKTVTFPADTGGTRNQTGSGSGLGLEVNFYLACGTDFTSGTLNSSWTASTANATRCVGQINNFDSTSNNIFFTGIQLEAGSVATPYEHRDYDDELRRCQRYFYKTYPQGTNPGTDTATDICSWRNQMDAGRTDMTLNIPFAVPMRSTPTIVGYSKNGNSNKYLETGIDYSGGNEGTFAGTVYVGRKYLTQLSSGNSVDSGNYAHFHFTAAAEL